MTSFVLKRLLQAAMVMLAMSMAVFIAINVIGDPVAVLAPPTATDAEIAQMRTNLGLDLPLYAQYWRFLVAAANGDFGVSFNHGVPALQLVLERFPATVELTLAATLISIGLGLPVGLMAGMSDNRKVRRLLMFGSASTFSMPTFWVGLLLIMVFAVNHQLLPAGGRGATQSLFGFQLSMASAGGWRHLLLPAVTLSLFNVGLIARLAYSATQEIRSQDFVRFAQAQGLSQRKIIGVHILPNILIPIVTVLGLEIGSLLTGSIITESVFAWPGVGKLAIDAINVLDRPVILAFMIFAVAIVVVINLIVDILHGFIDPRIRIGAAS
jgi:peptide/nickel transport system permease protein